MDSTNPVIMLEDVWIRRGNEYVLEHVDLQLYPGDFACIYGRSGSGKTSLLRILALIDRPDRGRVVLGGRDYSSAGDGERADARARLIGYIPQHDNIIDQLLVWENIALPLLLQGLSEEEALEKARSAASSLGIDALLYRRPQSLSGGQRRRVAILRALIKDPPILVADEPLTGLDDELIQVVYRIFSKHSNNGKTVIYATPDTTDNPPCTRVFRIKARRLVEE
ncbi:MAG: ATP-binding cassette domain-containing protein [Desulfurococcales archaeon]|nr:ATP-binding cassette domain-containing protein [Desulfurococcales archaeon]